MIPKSSTLRTKFLFSTGQSLIFVPLSRCRRATGRRCPPRDQQKVARDCRMKFAPAVATAWFPALSVAAAFPTSRRLSAAAPWRRFARTRKVFVARRRLRLAVPRAAPALDARDRVRLRLYYAEERTLAEIGRNLGEHESSVSRNLERVRKELRTMVEALLRAGKGASNGGPDTARMRGMPGMDDGQIALCIQYAADGAGIDLDKLLGLREGKKVSSPDRVLEP